MAKLERIYTIPLRREWLKAPIYKRAKKAATAVREFLIKHMKSDDVRLGNRLNNTLWERGIKKPPHHIKVTAVKFDDNVVRAELVGYPLEEPKKEKKGKLEGLKEKVLGAGKKEEKPVAQESTMEEKPKKRTKKTEPKPEQPTTQA